MLAITGMSVSYGAHRALDDASVRVESGEIVVILGANGAGKSSLLKAVCGTSEGQVRGQVKLNDKLMSNLPAEEIVTNGIAFVPEGRGIFGDLTVKENLLLGAHAIGARRHQDVNLDHVHRLFPKLQERENQTTRTMSGGEQQMVAIGRAIMANPKFLLLDEPSLGLSPLLCKELFQSLTQVRDSGIGVLMVEQNAKQSLAIADRAYLLENGSIVGENTAQAMMNDPAVQAAYLGVQKGGHATVETGSGAVYREKVVSTAKNTGASERKYIQPAGVSQPVNTNDPYSGFDISSLVSKAENIAAKSSTGSKNALKPDSASSQTNGVSIAQVPNEMTAPIMSSNDPQVQNLLTEFEVAAKRARVGSGSSNGNGKTNREVQKNEALHTLDENLPTIPVFRKSKVEIYRRNLAGKLSKVKER